MAIIHTLLTRLPSKVTILLMNKTQLPTMKNSKPLFYIALVIASTLILFLVYLRYFQVPKVDKNVTQKPAEKSIKVEEIDLNGTILK